MGTGVEKGPGLGEALESGRFTPKIISDRQLARESGITGAPALLISAGRNGYLLGGAQPYDTGSG